MQIDGKEVANIHKKPWWMYFIPWLIGDTGIALYPTIYISSSMHRDLTGPTPSPRSVSVVLHELEHLTRAKKIGVVRYYFSYIFKRSFRFEEELACKKVEIEYLKGRGESLDIQRAARILSSWIYGWCATEQEAVTRLSSL